MKEPVVSIFKDLCIAAKNNDAFKWMSHKELEAMVTVDIARIAIDTVSSAVKSGEIEKNQEDLLDQVIASESIRLIKQMSENDLPKRQKENCEKAIRAILDVPKIILGDG